MVNVNTTINAKERKYIPTVVYLQRKLQLSYLLAYKVGIFLRDFGVKLGSPSYRRGQQIEDSSLRAVQV